MQRNKEETEQGALLGRTGRQVGWLLICVQPNDETASAPEDAGDAVTPLQAGFSRLAVVFSSDAADG